jgi:hypothetical protein
MHLKTQYREKNNSGAVADIQAVEVNTPPNSAADISLEQKSDHPANGADFALKRQVEALRHNEQLQRQYFEQQQQARLMREARLQDMRPPSREEKLAVWKQNGLTPANEQFLIDHPEMIDHDQLTAYATQQALASGIEHDSDNFRHAVKQNFDTAMRHLKAQAEHESPTPEFFAPPPKPTPEPASVKSALFSAPSRQISNGDRNLSLPSRVSLSAEERQIAAASGISDKQYAENKLRMMRMKQTGEIQQ